MYRVMGLTAGQSEGDAAGESVLGRRDGDGQRVRGVAPRTPDRPKKSIAIHAGAGHIHLALREQRTRAPGVGIAGRACTLGEALEAEAESDTPGRLGLVPV